MTTYVSDAFTGTTGAVWDVTKWTVGGTSTTAAKVDIQTNVGRMYCGSDTGYSGKISAIVNTATHANSEILVDFKFTTAESFFNINLRGESAGDGSDSYQFIAGRSGNVRIERVASYSGTQIATASFSIADNTWYTVRFQAVGTAIQARIWATAGSEPGSWTLSATDSGITAAGYAYFNLNGGNLGGATLDVDNFVYSDGATLATKSASDTGSSSDSTGSLNAAISATENGLATEILSAKGLGALETSGSTDLGQIAGTPKFASETSSSSDVVSSMNAVIAAAEMITYLEGAHVVIPPLPVVDYELVHSSDIARRVGKGPYLLKLPYTEGVRAPHRFWRRLSTHRGVSLLRIAGVFQLVEEPDVFQLEAADRVYLGGYEYWVTDDQAQELGDGGYASFVQGFTYVPNSYYGVGQYGVSIYGN
jgi:hypothetical protein